MKKIFAFIIACLLIATSSGLVYADSSDYTEEELNIIANTVNGEVGGITGTILITYCDGSQEYVDGSRIRYIHAAVIDNQVKSNLFPNNLRSCVSQCWSTKYLSTSWKSSTQWQTSRTDAIYSLDNCSDIPNNVFAATCDSRFANRYTSFKLWARVDWDTGWYSGTFYYYTYGDATYDISEPEDLEDDTYGIFRKDTLLMWIQNCYLNACGKDALHQTILLPY